MRGFSSGPHAHLIARADHSGVSSTPWTRLAPALLLVAILIVGVVVGGAVLARGLSTEATPRASATSSATPLPSAVADLPDADVPGEDLARLPRYPGSVRTEYDVSSDAGFALTMTEYLADATIDEVRTYYRGVMLEHGWQRADIGYAAGEWTYVLVDGAVEALVEIELSRGFVEIDLQVSEPIPSPEPSPSPTPVPTARPAAPTPIQPVVPPSDDDDDDDGETDDGASDDDAASDG
jgi:hypothetical protein